MAVVWGPSKNRTQRCSSPLRRYSTRSAELAVGRRERTHSPLTITRRSGAGSPRLDDADVVPVVVPVAVRIDAIAGSGIAAEDHRRRSVLAEPPLVLTPRDRQLPPWHEHLADGREGHAERDLGERLDHEGSRRRRRRRRRDRGARTPEAAAPMAAPTEEKQVRGGEGEEGEGGGHEGRAGIQRHAERGDELKETGGKGRGRGEGGGEEEGAGTRREGAGGWEAKTEEGEGGGRAGRGGGAQFWGGGVRLPCLDAFHLQERARLYAERGAGQREWHPPRPRAGPGTSTSGPPTTPSAGPSAARSRRDRRCARARPGSPRSSRGRRRRGRGSRG